MWYEIIPSAAIITGLLATPFIADRYIHRLWTGKPYLRDTTHPRATELILRDIRLTGDQYKPLGIEVVPDLDKE